MSDVPCRVRVALTARSAYLALCGEQPLVALQHARRVLAGPRGADALLARVYAAEALAMLGYRRCAVLMCG